MAVFRAPLMAVSLENVFSPEKTRPSSVSEIRAPHATVTGLAGFESGEGLVDLAHGDALGFSAKGANAMPKHPISLAKLA